MSISHFPLGLDRDFGQSCPLCPYVESIGVPVVSKLSILLKAPGFIRGFSQKPLSDLVIFQKIHKFSHFPRKSINLVIFPRNAVNPGQWYTRTRTTVGTHYSTDHGHHHAPRVPLLDAHSLPGWSCGYTRVSQGQTPFTRLVWDTVGDLKQLFV